jgi:MFS family permease
MGSACRTGPPSPSAGEMTRGESTPMSTGGPANPSPNQPNVKYVLLLGLMCALPAVTSDIYLPSLPEVARDLHTTTTAVQLTMSGVLVGGAVSQLVVGPLSDRFGRRRPVLIGIALHILISLLCALAPGIGTLIALRVVQGFFNAAATVVAIAVIRDRFTGSDASRLLSRLMLVIGVAPLFAPTVVGLIAGQWGWRSVFVALALFGAALWPAVWRRLPETLLPERRRAAGLGPALHGYRVLLRDQHFVAIAVLPGLGMAVLMSYVIGSPFVLREGYGLSANQFALLFAMNGVGIVGGPDQRLTCAASRADPHPALCPAAVGCCGRRASDHFPDRGGRAFRAARGAVGDVGPHPVHPAERLGDRAQQARRDGRHGCGLHRRDAGRGCGGRQPARRRTRRRRRRHVPGHDCQRNRGPTDSRDRHTCLSPWGLAATRGLLNTASRSTASRNTDSRLTNAERQQRRPQQCRCMNVRMTLPWRFPLRHVLRRAPSQRRGPERPIGFCQTQPPRHATVVKRDGVGFHSDCIPPPPTYAQVSIPTSPTSTATRVRTYRRIPGGRRTRPTR